MVTPFVGVWIEIIIGFPTAAAFLKVTPFVGVWIEILMNRIALFVLISHSHRGSVD